MSDELKTGKIMPRDYQVDAFNAATKHIRNYSGPAFVTASVGAGKTIMIGMIAKRCQDVGLSCLVLARQGELIDQTQRTLWAMDVKNSVFSASLNQKSTTFPIICGTEGTVARALENEFSEYAPMVLQIDESHMVDWEDSLKDEPATQYGIIIRTLLNRNQKMRIIGYTGSPFRGVDPILGDFWKEKLLDVGTEYLVNRGYLVPTEFGFGHDDVQYDLSEFKHSGEEGAKDYTSKELQAMQRKILKEGTTTQRIMLEVQQIQERRGGVSLVTCAGKKHCEEAAKYLPEGSYAIVTDAISTRERKRILDAARSEELEYVFQVGCLTTGVDVPSFSTCVILRNIGSLTLLVQLIGRVLRPYIKDDVLAGEFFTTEPEEDDRRKEILSISSKPAALVLDYSSTMHELGELYHNPILEQAELARATRKGDLITCPQCETLNSIFARRCIGQDDTQDDGRCDFFWLSKQCECGVHNDTAARECRVCHAQLVDPNDKLTGKHYTDDDLQEVSKMTITPTRCGHGILVTYYLADDKATEVFWPESDNIVAKRMYKMKFVARHVQDNTWRNRAMQLKTVPAIMKNQAIFSTPTHITHRRNDKGKSIIAKKLFASGREEIDNYNDV